MARESRPQPRNWPTFSGTGQPRGGIESQPEFGRQEMANENDKDKNDQDEKPKPRPTDGPQPTNPGDVPSPGRPVPPTVPGDVPSPGKKP